MAPNSRTWFYTEPERRAYYIEERVNQSLWAARFGSIYLDCVRAEPPFRMEGNWNGINVALEWQPNKWLRVISDKEDRTLISGFAIVLQFNPAFSFADENGNVSVEWWRVEAEGTHRRREIEGHAMYTNVKTYKR